MNRCHFFQLFPYAYTAMTQKGPEIAKSSTKIEWLPQGCPHAAECDVQRDTAPTSPPPNREAGNVPALPGSLICGIGEEESMNDEHDAISRKRRVEPACGKSGMCKPQNAARAGDEQQQDNNRGVTTGYPARRNPTHHPDGHAHETLR